MKIASERESGAQVREPAVQRAFEYVTRMDAGVNIGLEDLDLETWDLIGVVEQEKNRMKMRKHKEAEAQGRRLK